MADNPPTNPATIDEALAKVQQTEAELRKTKSQLSDVKTREAQARSKNLQGAKAEDVNKELLEFADQQARENTILRTAMEFNLDPKDLEGIDFQSPLEVRLKAENISLTRRHDQLTKDIAAQRNQLEAVAARVHARDEEELGAESSGSAQMEQGLSSAEARASGGQQGETDYDRARAQGRTVKGRRRLLHAIYRDPSKIIPAAGRND